MFLSLNNATVKNLIVEDIIIKTPFSAGAIAGVARGNSTISNCYVVNSVVESKLSTCCAGIVGVAVPDTNSSNNNITIDNCMVKSTAVNTEMETVESKLNTAGILGAGFEVQCTISNCKVFGYDKAEVVDKDTFSAGIVDYFTGGNITIDSCHVQNARLTKNGILNCSESGIAKIMNCTVKNTSCGESGIAGVVKTAGSIITNCNVQSSSIGKSGIVNWFYGTEISKCSVKNANVGISGILSSCRNSTEVTISECRVQNINAPNSGIVGELTQNSSYPFNVFSCTAKNSSLGNSGIIGTCYGILNVEDCKVQGINAIAGMLYKR